MDLPAGQDDLIEAVENANPHTVVVLNTGDPVTMAKWIDKTPTLLDMWYGGQEGGHALAAILFGDANPSGKLPVTFPKRFAGLARVRSTIRARISRSNYAEGIYVGYRYYDTKNVEPQFPFGFGLSYTNFEYSDLKVVIASKRLDPRSRSVTANVRNTRLTRGSRSGRTLCARRPRKIDRPAHELKGFQRVELNPGETKTVHFTLDRAAFSYWNPATKAWQADPGTFEVEVGALAGHPAARTARTEESSLR